MKTERSRLLYFSITCMLFFLCELNAKSLHINIAEASTFRCVKDLEVTQLKITGLLNKRTFKTIQNNFPNVEMLDMGTSRVVAYVDENKVAYPANEIPVGAFSKRICLKKVILPVGIVKIGKGAFWSCVNLESIIFSDSVKIIDQFAFQLCKKLKQITLPASIESIGGASFASCTALTSIKCTSKLPPQMPDWNPFPDFKNDACTVFVPVKSIGEYQASRIFKNFHIKSL